MALCIAIDGITAAGRPAASTTHGYAQLPWSLAEASMVDGEYVCTSGTHLLMSVAEVNAKPALDLQALGITPETILIVASMGAALVLGSYFSGWGVGLAKDLIKKI